MTENKEPWVHQSCEGYLLEFPKPTKWEKIKLKIKWWGVELKDFFKYKILKKKPSSLLTTPFPPVSTGLGLDFEEFTILGKENDNHDKSNNT